MVPGTTKLFGSLMVFMFMPPYSPMYTYIIIHMHHYVLTINPETWHNVSSCIELSIMVEVTSTCAES